MVQQQDVIYAGSENLPLMLYREGYVSWKSRMLRYLNTKQNGKQHIESILKDKEAINIILLRLPDEVYMTVDAAKSANEFTSIPGETIKMYYIIYTTQINKFAWNGFDKRPIEANIKFLNHLQPEWRRDA
ncbi:hypothetical protein Tco_0777895 [Tanacetum coccineum]